jgi:hypothetical protein
MRGGRKQRLLVSVRGKNDTLEAVKGGAHIIDAEYPGSALGTSYPANIYTIRQFTPPERLVSTNIGEKQFVWSTAGQAAVGVAYAGADIVKVGLAELDEQFAMKVMRDVTKQVRFFFKKQPRLMITTLFADSVLRGILDPITQGVNVSVYAKADGVLIDTFDKQCGQGLLDWLTLREIRTFVKACHSAHQEAWIAGSITRTQMHSLWKTGVDVICVRGAACEKGTARQGEVDASRVRALVNTIA